MYHASILDHFHLHKRSKLNPVLPINHDVLILPSLTQGLTIITMPGAVVSSVRVLALHDVKLCLDAVNNLLQCFVSNARLLESMRFEIAGTNVNTNGLEGNRGCSRSKRALRGVLSLTLYVPAY